MLMKNLRPQILACEYMEKTYGKDWQKRNLNQASITNAFIEGYNSRDNEAKVATEISLSEKSEKILRQQVDRVAHPEGTFFGLRIVVREDMPDNMAALVDDEGNVLTHLYFNFK